MSRHLHEDHHTLRLGDEAFPSRPTGEYSPVVPGEAEGMFTAIQDGKLHKYDRHDAKRMLAALTDFINDNGNGPRRAA